MNAYKFSFNIVGNKFVIYKQPEEIKPYNFDWRDPVTGIYVESCNTPEVRQDRIFIRGTDKWRDEREAVIKMDIDVFRGVMTRFQLYVEESF